MIAVNLKSPFIISVNETGQIGSKVEVFIWKFGESVPASPQWTMKKDIPTATQLKNEYEISQKIRYSLNIVAPSLVTTPANEANDFYCFFRVKRYKYTGSYTLLDTTDYVGVDGYTLFENGVNYTNSNNLQPLFNIDLPVNYFRNGVINYVNYLFNHNGTDTILVEYTKLSGTNAVTNNILTSSDTAGVYLKKIPITKSSVNYYNGNICNIKVNGSIVSAFQSIPIEEIRYTPVRVDFINRFGGWQSMTFFKVRRDTITVNGKEYANLQQSSNYNVQIGQRKAFDKNGTLSIKLNSGFVDENFDELIQDLLLSEVVLLDNLPVLVKTNSVEKFRHLTTKNINYAIDFEHAFNLLNDVK